MYTHKNLVWIKNVKRREGKEWAYMEYDTGDTFLLNWSSKAKWGKTNAQEPKPNQLILLFQKIDRPEVQKEIYLTHIVTPLDNVLMVDSNSPTHEYARLVGVVAKPENLVPKPNTFDFYKPNRGACCSIDLIESNQSRTYTLSDKQRIIWKLFNLPANLDNEFEGVLPVLESPDEELSAIEGEERYRLALHKSYERNQKIIRQAKQKAREESRFYCEVCTFNFADQYPGLGDDFIECHHKDPIASNGIRKTTVKDLALVCANCHRMLHRKYQGEYLTIEELRRKYFKLFK